MTWRELDEEAKSHIEEKALELIDQGVPEAEAWTRARREFGNTTRTIESSREVWIWTWLENFWFDLRITVRGLRRDRSFTASSIAILAVALAMNLTVFTISNAMLFRGFPLVRDNSRLLYLQERNRSGGPGPCCISFADFEDWRTQTQAFEGISYIGERFVAVRAGNERPLDTLAFVVSANTFGLLGVTPVLGRDFTAEDELAGAAPVAILNYRFWVTNLGAKRDIVGARIYLSNVATTVVGVMPEGFDFPTKENLWIPVTPTAELRRRGMTPGGFMAVAKLRSGVSRQEAEVELETVNRRLEAAYPATNRGLVATAGTHANSTSGEHAFLIWGTAWAGACFVLLAACANLANLALVRTMGRSREFSARLALGAPLARVIAQSLVEGLFLATIAATGAWTISWWAVKAWAISTESRYQVLNYAMDGAAFAYLAGITVAAALLLSLAPAANMFRLAWNGLRSAAPRAATLGVRGERLSAALVAVQIALAVVLLSGASVLVRSVLAIVNADTGVRNPEAVFAGFVQLPADKYPNQAARLAYFDSLAERLGAVPGIEGVTFAGTMPIRGINERAFDIDGQATPPDGAPFVQVFTTGPGYFGLVAGPPKLGRDFTSADRIAAQPVALVNQSLAEKYFPGQPVIGRRIRTRNPSGPGDWRTIVGVVPNVMQGDGTRQTFRPLIYVPIRQIAPPQGFFLVRTRATSGLAQSIQSTVAAIDRDVPVEEFTNLKDTFRFDRDMMDAEHSELGKYASLAPAFSLISLLLAAVGLHAVIAHTASRRTKEIGIRMAVGATATDIRTAVLRSALLPVTLGIASGLLAAVGVNRILGSLLVGVSPTDLTTFTSAVMAMATLALLSSYLPALRATRVDPATVLRND